MNTKVNFQFQKPEHSHGFLLYKLYNKWESGIKKLLRNIGLTHPQFVVLTTTAWFETYEHSPTQIELSSRTSIDAMTVGVILQGLIKKGYVSRARSSVDSRAYIVQLTDSGTHVVQQSMDAVDAYDIEFFSKLTNEEKDQFSKNSVKLF